MTERPDWQRAFEMMGTDGVNPVTVLLAPDGQMYAVLQGEYAGELRTIKLDDEGRISAFVIDSIDAWDQMLAVGNAELAARLGSPVSYDRRGQQIYGYDFGGGWGVWTPSGDGDDNAQRLDPVAWQMGGYSARLRPGKDGDRYAKINTILDPTPARRLGVTCLFSVEAETGSFGIEVEHDNLGFKYKLGFRWSDENNQLEFWNFDDEWESRVINVQYPHDKTQFFMMKVVWDSGTGYYTRAQCAGYNIDLSDEPIPRGVTDGVWKVDTTLIVRSVGTDVGAIYVDRVISTSSEPE